MNKIIMNKIIKYNIKKVLYFYIQILIGKNPLIKKVFYN